MAFRKFLLFIVGVIRRLQLSRSVSYQRLFIDLAPLLIKIQDRRLPFGDAASLLAPYQGMLGAMIPSLARGREALPGSVGRLTRLPCGCRIGKLHFSPLLQLAKLLHLPEVSRVQFDRLPSTRTELFDHYLARIGLGRYGSEPPGFATLFGFKFRDLVDQLVILRRTDPVLFMMLIANEFGMAREWASDHPQEAQVWIERAATLAEFERLIEIVAFVKDHPGSSAQLREAVRILAKGTKTRSSTATLRKHLRFRFHIDQLGLGVEGLRALFIGDRAPGDAGGPLAPIIDWSSVTAQLRRVAAARCAWFAKDELLPVKGFRQLPKRFVRSRRNSAYTYYGIPLDVLLVVGIKDLSLAVGRRGGVHSVNPLAATIWENLMGEEVNFDRQARQATVFEQVYLRELGYAGSNARFCPNGWFGAKADEALYARLWRLFISGSNRTGAKSVRYQIRASINVLSQLVVPFWRQQMPIDPTEASKVVAQLACGLTAISMDPVFAALMERALVERDVPIEFRSDPFNRPRDAAENKRRVEAFFKRHIRSAYARFEGVDRRLNHDPETTAAPPLTVRKTLPRAHRPAATVIRRAKP